MKQDEQSRHAHQTGLQALVDMHTYHEKQPASRGREDNPWKEWRNQPADEVDDGDQLPPLGSLLGPLVCPLLCCDSIRCRRLPPFFPLLISPLVCILFCCDSILCRRMPGSPTNPPRGPPSFVGDRQKLTGPPSASRHPFHQAFHHQTVV